MIRSYQLCTFRRLFFLLYTFIRLAGLATLLRSKLSENYGENYDGASSLTDCFTLKPSNLCSWSVPLNVSRSDPENDGGFRAHINIGG